MNKPKCKIDAYGDKRWYLNNQLHREDGPAIEYADGEKRWYLYGKPVTEEENTEERLVEK